MRIDLGARRALLPLQAEGRTQHALDRDVQIRACRDVGRVLAAHLGDDRFRVTARPHRLQQVHAHFQAAGEGVPIDARMMRQRRAGLRAPEPPVHAAARHACGIAGAEQQGAGQRGARRRLVHNRVARQQGRADHVDGKRQRKIEGRDDGEHAVRPQHVMRAFIGKCAGQRLAVAVAAFRLIAVVADQVHRFFGFAQRFQARFPDFDDGAHRKVVLAFGQHRRQPAKHLDAGGPALRGPGRLRAPGAVDGQLDDVAPRSGKAPDQQAVVDRR
ncbi:hypothetical protein D3C72_1326400 [compost metagenome]